MLVGLGLGGSDCVSVLVYAVLWGMILHTLVLFAFSRDRETNYKLRLFGSLNFIVSIAASLDKEEKNSKK